MRIVKAFFDIGYPREQSVMSSQPVFVRPYRIVLDQELQILDRLKLVGFEDLGLRGRVSE